ncbi:MULTISPECIES: type II toxin-antitoxin system HicB family antitoxin [Methylosinus]|uniref:HicB family protein n=1 Tax=Methylosinus trichosporium (strain ATCC 35070 / NCIMB 11131 / UNIQEM 75 / OB3b) TaxID=595536 RepID=A0A2D2CVS2_METT3|nr:MULTISPECIES: type II toxin-antitoxin system HicB family antitoxin [Methylosinus]ATQ66847.1 HicB family protein [Methylosinus trichosporium OB3b]OBS54281.1 hypothetical protein A8B73_01450 [Methylosinus sp. 3S-1]
MNYAIALIHEENGSFGISFPDFPGCISTASTIDEVIAKGGQALALHVEGMMEDGKTLPHLRGVRELRADPEMADWFEDATVAAIGVDLPKRVVRINISIDQGLLERIDRTAKALGQSRSAFLADAAKLHIADN